MVYKFRTMTVCEDDPLMQATRFDLRVTPVGAFLRRTSLDELPQLFNVLGGSMSLVGPRPHAVAHNEHYRKLVSGYMLRHKVRPGITGLAQVNGLRGETANIEEMRQRVEFDLEYLKNWSVGLDIRILLKTVSIVLRRSKRLLSGHKAKAPSGAFAIKLDVQAPGGAGFRTRSGPVRRLRRGSACPGHDPCGRRLACRRAGR